MNVLYLYIRKTARVHFCRKISAVYYMYCAYAYLFYIHVYTRTTMLLHIHTCMCVNSTSSATCWYNYRVFLINSAALSMPQCLITLSCVRVFTNFFLRMNTRFRFIFSSGDFNIRIILKILILLCFGISSFSYSLFFFHDIIVYFRLQVIMYFLQIVVGVPGIRWYIHRYIIIILVDNGIFVCLHRSVVEHVLLGVL